MESIVLHTDVARLVLGYLMNQNLKLAADTLCKTSPHLQHEFVALKQGLQTHNFLNGGLEEIIREHVKITTIVTSAVQKMPLDARLQLQQLKLSERVSELLKMEHGFASLMQSQMNDIAPATTADAQHVMASQGQRKRRHSRFMLNSPPSEGDSPEVITHDTSKRARLLAPHFYCNSELHRSHLTATSERAEGSWSASAARIDRNMSTDDTDASTLSENNSICSIGKDHIDKAGVADENDTLLLSRPRNNSTPCNAPSNSLIPTPQTMPELTDAILTNQDFQEKLLNNINIALQTVTAPSAVGSEALLDGIVRNILEATEKDPSFDRIIQDVVGVEVPDGTPSRSSMAQQEHQSAPLVNAVAAAEPAPPQTPLIIRTAVASAVTAVSDGDANIVNASGPMEVANTSIGTLIDPNFSISKLIVLNSNESAQKQQQCTDGVNISFSSDNLVNFGDGVVADTDTVSGQVYVDTTTGQLTFPMYISNDGLLSQLPFLVNNEWLAQQLRTDAFANSDVSHIEIPLPEPITLTANQLPPNSIIINSAQKQPQVEPLPQLPRSASLLSSEGTERQRNVQQLPALVPTTAPVVAVEPCTAPPASLDSSRMQMERVTPSTSGIVNVKAFRSLSTPRKSNSHVRTLNFSPKVKGPLHAAHQALAKPLSTRRDQLQKSLQPKEEEGVGEKADVVQPDKPIINNVEILASVASNASDALPIAASNADVSANESNGSVPPFFAMEESSNQTVIKAVTAKKVAKATKASVAAASSMPQTPKRRQKRRAAVNAYKRMISLASAMEESPLSEVQPEKRRLAASAHVALAERNDSAEASKENQDERTKQPNRGDSPISKERLHDESLAAWQRQLHSSKHDLETRLREINAKRLETVKVGGRPRKTRIAKKKAKPSVSMERKQGMAEAAEPSMAAAVPVQPQSLKKTKKKSSAGKAQRSSGRGSGEFNIKITTPQKGTKVELKQSSPPLAAARVAVSQEAVVPQTAAPEVDTSGAMTLSLVPSGLDEPTKDMGAEQEKRTANIALLLDTPFKEPHLLGSHVPPTPGMMLMPLDTPYTKLLPSSSFLFGSDTKSIMDTPLLSAITPGLRCTPFGLSQGTPRSAAKTDYSSGSSYYRPDEAEHMDTNAQYAIPPLPPAAPIVPKEQAREQQPKLETTCFEMVAERLPVEPMVLRRVRSFGSEAVDSMESAALVSGTELSVDAHYKLVAGLPDAVAHAEDSSSSSSSTSSSTSSSSSSSSTSSSSPSLSSSSTSGRAPATPTKALLLDMENLSDISSTEDEEWLKVATAAELQPEPLSIDNQPAQLVSQDGEVRYPLRNWLTPSKESSVAAKVDTSGESTTATIKYTLPAKSAEKVNQHLQELAEVRERVKQKVKQSSVQEKKKPVQQSAASAAHRKLAAIRQKKKAAKPAKQSELQGVAAVEAASTPPRVLNDRDPALLIALNLSAKKQQPTPTKRTLDKIPTLGPHSPAKRMALEIPAQPAPSPKQSGNAASIGNAAKVKARGRPKKLPNKAGESARTSTRRSSRIVDDQNRVQQLKEAAAADGEKKSIAAPKRGNSKRRESVTVAAASAEKQARPANSKDTRKPAKKRAEARIEAQPTIDIAEAQTTQPELNVPDPVPASQERSVAASEQTSHMGADFDMYLAASHGANTFSHVYADNGPRMAQPVARLPPSYLEQYQTRVMVDKEVHTIRIGSSQVLHEVPAASAASTTSRIVAIRNIPKKRNIRFSTSNSTNVVSMQEPSATSTPLAAEKTTALPTPATPTDADEADLEVAAINTSAKADEEQLADGDDTRVQIEDIESILSHLHGT